MEKKTARLRRAKSTRARIRELGVPRLSVLRTGQHLYAQLFTADGSKVLAAASTVQADVKDGLKNGKNADAAVKVGRMIAEKAKAAGVSKVAFDRSGYRYHGRIKALADAARSNGSATVDDRTTSSASEPEMIEELLAEQLRDLLNAETQLVKALPRMVKAARAESLKLAFEHHLEETKEQVERLK